jgi:hypothetical protein
MPEENTNRRLAPRAPLIPRAPRLRQKIARFVDDCWTIHIGLFRVPKRGNWRARGELVWTGRRTGAVSMTAKYRIIGFGAEGGRPRFLLNTPQGEQSIWLDSTSVTFGRRWWFVCPRCGYRTSKLHKPAASSMFECRLCYRLRYRSQKHESDWFYRNVSQQTGVPKRLLRRWLYRVGDSCISKALGK